MAYGSCNVCGCARSECECSMDSARKVVALSRHPVKAGRNDPGVSDVFDTIGVEDERLHVVVLRGPSGIGKTTFANWCLEAAGWHVVDVVSADHFFTKDGRYEFDRTKLGLAHADCYARFLAVLQRPLGARIVLVDNTNTEAWHAAPYILAAQAHGLPYRIVELDDDVSVGTLARRNVHGVDERTICRQAAQILKKLPSEWRENVIRVRKDGRRYVRIPVEAHGSVVRAQ